MHVGSSLIPPETLTCESPGTLCIELNTSSTDPGLFEAAIRETTELNCVRIYTESEHSGSALRVINAAARLVNRVELFVKVDDVRVSVSQDLVSSGLDSLNLLIQGSGEGVPDCILDSLNSGLQAWISLQQDLAFEKPEINVIFEAAAGDLCDLPSVVALAAKYHVEHVTLYASHAPEGNAGRWHSFSGLIERVRTEFPQVSIDASTCEDDPAQPLDAHPRFTPREPSGSERVFSCLESPWDSVRLLPDGDLISCSFRRDAPLGNTGRQSLQEIWHGAEYNEFRRRFQSGDDSVCRRCPRKLAYIPGPLRSELRPDNGNTPEFLDGWHWSEGKVIWSGPRSRCVLAVETDPEGGADRSEALLELHGLLPGGKNGTPNELTVLHKGHTLATFRNSADTLQAFRLDIPVREPSNAVHLEFVTSRAYRPRESGSVDRRELGFALVSLRGAVPPARRLSRMRLAPFYLALKSGRILGRLLSRFQYTPERLPEWQPGMSIIIPERGTPALLRDCLISVMAALGRLDEPFEVIVVVNGCAFESYVEHRERFPAVRWFHSESVLGYGDATALGVRRARFDWVYLLNSDMTVGRESLREVGRWRSRHVFAVSSQVFFADPRRRREETGWTNFKIDKDGPIELFDATPEDQFSVRGHLYAGGGNSLFRKKLLCRFMSQAMAYEPFYWEDVEWGVRAWRAGFEVLFCPTSHVTHVHRATISRYFSATAIDRIWKRNQIQFSVRNGFTDLSSRMITRNLRSSLNRKTQKELTGLRRCLSLFLALLATGRSVVRDVDFGRLNSKRYISPGSASRPKMLIVSPFTVYPARHGSARRIASLIGQLSRVFDIVLLTDEESEYCAGHIAPVRGPISVHLTGGRGAASLTANDRITRIRTHSHCRLRAEMERLALAYDVAIIQIEHVELAALAPSSKCRVPCVIDLHDVLLSGGENTEEDRFEEALIARHHAALTCSAEDAALLHHAQAAVVPNGFTSNPGDWRSSRGSRLILFAGPFRFQPNLLGIITFLENVYPALAREVPGVELAILGGTGSRAIAAQHACFDQPGVVVINEPVPVRPWLERCALTINPLHETRGSCLKVIEAVGFGRVCVSTEAGARGFRGIDTESLIVVPDIQEFKEPVHRLLVDEELRTRIEKPDPRALAPLAWEGTGSRLLLAYECWFGRRVFRPAR